MAGPLVCETCGRTNDVDEVLVHYGDRVRKVAICTTCKAERLERKRVRAHARRPSRSPLTTAGLGLVAIGILFLLLLGGLAFSRALRPEKKTDCYPGAGFSC